MKAPPLTPYPALEVLDVGTLIDWPGNHCPRPPVMKRMCSGTPGKECGLVLGWVVCLPALDGLITHGTCVKCCNAAVDALEQLLASEITLDVGAGEEPATQAVAPMLLEKAANLNARKALGHADILPPCAPGARVDRQNPNKNTKSVWGLRLLRDADSAGDTTRADGGRTPFPR